MLYRFYYRHAESAYLQNWCWILKLLFFSERHGFFQNLHLQKLVNLAHGKKAESMNSIWKTSSFQLQITQNAILVVKTNLLKNSGVFRGIRFRVLDVFSTHTCIVILVVENVPSTAVWFQNGFPPPLPTGKLRKILRAGGQNNIWLWPVNFRHRYFSILNIF